MTGGYVARRKLFRTVDQYEEQIANVTEALGRIALLGEETENNSGGSQRRSREARMETLTKYLERLQDELDDLQGVSQEPVSFESAW